MARLHADHVTLSYDDSTTVVDTLTLHVPDRQITSIVGPNGCGKSTLLRALARLMAPREGVVVLDGEAIHRQSTKDVARRLCLLPQQPGAPEAITVEDLVQRGRYPHQSLLQPPSKHDRDAVEQALERAGMIALRHRPVDELSGGQRQRAWIAMALAQETPLLLLDEPTTYLDVAHQQEVLDLVQRLNREDERTVVLVLHDVNHAAQVSDHVVAMHDGRVLAEGAPEAVLTPHLLRQVFGVSCDVVVHPETNAPISVPRSRAPLTSDAPPAQFDDGLQAERLSAGYEQQRVIEDLHVSLPAGRISAIVGPNACGKSTLLRVFARLLRPQSGEVTLTGQPIDTGSHRMFAQRLAMLTQGAAVPPGLLVEELVAVGRYPYQRWYRQWSPTDQDAVDRAMTATGVVDLRWRSVDTLSGGQRQRVWLAMALAQQTEVLLLDEPTTFLDIAHQVDVLDLIWELNRTDGRTVVMVLHDLCQACRYADHLVAMKEGHVITAGAPQEIVSTELMQQLFGVESCIMSDPMTGCPLVMAGRASQRATVLADRGVPLA